MKLLVIGDLHHKNRYGLILIINHLGWEIKFGGLHDIPDFDVIYSPSQPIDGKKYPNKRFIFGPHFSVFPDNKINMIHNDNSVYIQPSKWAAETWINMLPKDKLRIVAQPFAVDTGKFSPDNSLRNKVMIYYKRRQPEEVQRVVKYLRAKGESCRIFNYVSGYDEEDYIKYLRECKYAVIVDAHESQGFAIQEAMSCNVPLLVWNVRSMNQEFGADYNDIPANTIPYWHEKCGEFFYDEKDFEKTYEKFMIRLDDYRPREYVIDNLGFLACGNILKATIASINI